MSAWISKHYCQCQIHLVIWTCFWRWEYEARNRYPANVDLPVSRCKAVAAVVPTLWCAESQHHQQLLPLLHSAAAVFPNRHVKLLNAVCAWLLPSSVQEETCHKVHIFSDRGERKKSRSSYAVYTHQYMKLPAPHLADIYEEFDYLSIIRKTVYCLQSNINLLYGIA